MKKNPEQQMATNNVVIPSLQQQPVNWTYGGEKLVAKESAATASGKPSSSFLLKRDRAF